MPTFTLWGGYNYAPGDEEHPTLEAAILKYAERARNGGTFKTDDTYHPLWGECADTEYVIVYDECEGVTLADVLAYDHYVTECEAENLEPHTFHMWQVHGQPKSPTG